MSYLGGTGSPNSTHLMLGKEFPVQKEKKLEKGDTKEEKKRKVKVRESFISRIKGLKGGRMKTKKIKFKRATIKLSDVL